MKMVKFLILQAALLFHFMSHFRNFRSKNAGNMIFSYFNIKSIRNMFENLCELVADIVDILCIAETKLDPSGFRSS